MSVVQTEKANQQKRTIEKDNNLKLVAQHWVMRQTLVVVGSDQKELSCSGSSHEEDEDQDELTSLQLNNGQSRSDTSSSLQADDEDGRQFNRLDPNRRSFSTPTVNQLQVKLEQATKSVQSQPKKQTAGKLRRRTALGLISLVSLQQQQQQTTGWRSWFATKSSNWPTTDNSTKANSSTRKFLLRNLRPQQTDKGKSHTCWAVEEEENLWLVNHRIGLTLKAAQ